MVPSLTRDALQKYLIRRIDHRIPRGFLVISEVVGPALAKMSPFSSPFPVAYVR